MLVCVWEEGGGWQVDFMFASYIEKGRKGGVPKSRTELRKNFTEDPSC